MSVSDLLYHPSPASQPTPILSHVGRPPLQLTSFASLGAQTGIFVKSVIAILTKVRQPCFLAADLGQLSFAAWLCAPASTARTVIVQPAPPTPILRTAFTPDIHKPAAIWQTFSLPDKQLSESTSFTVYNFPTHVFLQVSRFRSNFAPTQHSGEKARQLPHFELIVER